MLFQGTTDVYLMSTSTEQNEYLLSICSKSKRLQAELVSIRRTSAVKGQTHPSLVKNNTWKQPEETNQVFTAGVVNICTDNVILISVAKVKNKINQLNKNLSVPPSLFALNLTLLV